MVHRRKLVRNSEDGSTGSVSCVRFVRVWCDIREREMSRSLAGEHVGRCKELEVSLVYWREQC